MVLGLERGGGGRHVLRQNIIEATTRSHLLLAPSDGGPSLSKAVPHEPCCCKPIFCRFCCARVQLLAQLEGLLSARRGESHSPEENCSADHGSAPVL